METTSPHRPCCSNARAAQHRCSITGGQLILIQQPLFTQLAARLDLLYREHAVPHVGAADELMLKRDCFLRGRRHSFIVEGRVASLDDEYVQ
jgi:hypothetical protein